MDDWMEPFRIKRTCSESSCNESFRGSSKWSSIRASNEGWFLQRDGTVWCPKHIPDWVEKWRANKK